MLRRYPDAYHSCYTLAGLSTAQHHTLFHLVDDEDALTDYHSSLNAAFGWINTSKSHGNLGDAMDVIYEAEDQVNPIHPIYVIPWAAVKQTHAYYGRKVGF